MVGRNAVVERDHDTIVRYAKRLSNDPAFTEVLALLEQDAMNEFKTSAPDAPDVRERAYNKWMSIYQIQQQIQIWADEAG